MIRVIVSSDESGANEIVHFTDDFDAPADDFLNQGMTIDSDTRLDVGMPDAFPINYDLRRES